ncbi:MAG TPA: prepilin-type N-terminal cleavage/methylation domain-containing protein [Gemmatimonadaceae bacterium]|nr:prepilin-type N-terminal cleavage/methylation domain-containing protein [Gemmatimonadaceae bacterium]
MSLRHAPRARPGFTLLEVIISMSLLLVLMGMSVSLFRRETKSLSAQAGRLEAQQGAEFALNLIDRELRVAGVGLGPTQPLLVQADSMGLTFNGDLVAHDSGDLSAVTIDPDLDSLSTFVFNRSDRITLPHSAFTYPDSTYTLAGGVPSNAETISYWLSRDSTKGANEYILFRRVNARAIRVIATGIIVNPGDTVFQYFKADTGGLKAIPKASLPLYHSVDVHGSPADTGAAARIDSIRTVHVTFKMVYHDPKGDTFRKLETIVHLMNSGLDQHTSCGSAPIAVTPTGTVTPIGGGVTAPFVTVTWAHSVDDGGGEKDVDRYVIYKRLAAATSFSDPIASVPAGLATYSYVDSDVLSGQQLVYGVAAVDCTPSLSPMGITATDTIP